MKYTEFLDSLQEADVVARADYKVGPSGRKSHREIVFHDGSGTGKDEDEKKEVKEEKMTDAEMKKREDIVKGMKKNVAGFKARYGDRAKEVMYATATKLAKEEVELEENAPVAPGLVKHRIGVTVSDPNATSVTARKEKVQKFVRVTHSSNKEGAQKVGEKHFKKKGYVVHDSWHAGVVNEETISESDHDPWHDAQENKKSADAAKKQGDHKAYHMHMADHHENMAQWSMNRGRHAVANQHQMKADNHHDWAHGVKEAVELDEKFINGREYASQGVMHPDHAKMAIHQKTGQHIDFYASKTGDKMQGKVVKNDGKEVHIQAHKDKELGDGKLHKFKVTPHLPKPHNEELEVNFDQEGNLMAEKKTYAQFMEQLLEYTPGPGGVTRHVGTYGTAKGAKYGNTDYDKETMDKKDDDDEKPSTPAVKRGRGRPAGAKSGANQKVTSGKSYGGIATHSLNLPNTNR